MEQSARLTELFKKVTSWREICGNGEGGGGKVKTKNGYQSFDCGG